MDLSEQYIAQSKWRAWSEIINKLPLSKDQVVLDLGCGPGMVSNMLSDHVSKVVGIDLNTDLIKTANISSNANAEFIQGDISNLSWTNIDLVDGIWSSFTAAYFCDFKSILDNWLRFLKPGGWIAIIEIAELFLGHCPLPEDTYNCLTKLSDYMCESKVYDVDMGNKLVQTMQSLGLKDVTKNELEDKELSFQGAASNEILEAWQQRFERLSAIPRLFDEATSQKIKSDFLNCLASPDHKCSSKVIMVLARK